VAVVSRHEVGEGKARDDSHTGLPHELRAGGDAFGVLLADLQVVIAEAERSEADGGEKDDPHHDVVPLGPQQRGKDDRAENENAAHGRRAGFLAVKLGELMNFISGADGLADLEGDELADELVAIHQRQHEGRDGGSTCTEGVVFEEVEDLVERGVVAHPVMGEHPFAQFVKPVHHDA